MRAFKLTWALDTLNLIRGKKIAIVGGGLAGLTCGVVCLLRGAVQVTLYDRTHDRMAFQRDAAHRYVHPMIFRWPEANAGKRKTNFPILNWKSGTADEICRTVVDEAETFLEKCYATRGEQRAKSKTYRQRLGCDVRQLVFADNRIRVLAEGQQAVWLKNRQEYLPVGPIRNYYDAYDVVIVAVGYGLETEVDGIPFRSYWHLDTLSQPTIRGTWPKRWLVSGTGDGGLIDAIRLSLFDTDQKVLTDLLTGKFPEKKGIRLPKGWKKATWKNAIDKLRKDLLETEGKIHNRYADSQEKEKYEDQIGRDIQVEFTKLSDKPMHKETFEVLKKFLKRYERTDTVVYLNGLNVTPYSLNATLFQQFIIYLLMRHCGLRYRCGKARACMTPSHGGSYRFLFEKEAKGNGRLPADYLEVDDVVIRHGAESSFGALFGAKTLETTKGNSAKNEFEKTLWIDRLDQKWGDELPKPIDPKKKTPTTI